MHNEPAVSGTAQSTEKTDSDRTHSTEYKGWQMRDRDTAPVPEVETKRNSIQGTRAWRVWGGGDPPRRIKEGDSVALTPDTRGAVGAGISPERRKNQNFTEDIELHEYSTWLD